MQISLRAKLFIAFTLVAGVMAAVTVLAVGALHEQSRLSALSDQRQDAIVTAMATLRAAPFEAAGLVTDHLHSQQADRKSRLAADLVGLDTQEALALSTLSDLALGAEKTLVADLRLQATQAADLRQRMIAISSRDALGRATLLATREMPGLRAELTSALRAVGLQSGQTLAAAQAEAALNAIAAAQKNALLNPDPAFVTGQLATIALAQADFATAVAELAVADLAVAELKAHPAPGLGPLQGLIASLQGLDAQMNGLLRDNGNDTAATLFDLQLRPLDLARQEALDGLDTLFQTGRRMEGETARQAVNTWQTTLIALADVAMILGFGVVILGLSKLGRGLEGAVQLAERMAQSEVAAPAWVEGTIAGRLTAALVRISSGQTAVLASLDALAAGRTPRQDVPERFRQRLASLAEHGPLRQASGPAPEAVVGLKETLRAALYDGHEIREGAENLAGAMVSADPLAETARRHALVTERHLATLILAGQQAEGLLQGASPKSEAAGASLRRIA